MNQAHDGGVVEEGRLGREALRFNKVHLQTKNPGDHQVSEGKGTFWTPLKVSWAARVLRSRNSLPSRATPFGVATVMLTILRL